MNEHQFPARQDKVMAVLSYFQARQDKMMAVLSYFAVLFRALNRTVMYNLGEMASKFRDRF